MNNNQDNFNINPQMNNFNNTNNNPNNNTFFNNQNEFSQNQDINQPINIIPQNATPNVQKNLNQGFDSIQNNNSQMTPIQNQNNINNNNINSQNNNIFNNDNLNSQTTKESNLNDDVIMVPQEKNRFINNNQSNTNTALNDLNVEGGYNGMPKVDYSLDPKVQENIKGEQKKKNTITITGEAKVFLIIIVVLLLFTFVMPSIFDLIRDIQY